MSWLMALELHIGVNVSVCAMFILSFMSALRWTGDLSRVHPALALQYMSVGIGSSSPANSTDGAQL